MASDAIDTGLVSYLSGDATLSGLLTGGVYFATEPDTPTFPFAQVMLLSAKDVREFRRRSWEECRYVILVVGDGSTSLSTIRQACARIDVLLDGGTFAISGYTLMKSERERRYAGLVQIDEFEQPFILNDGFGGLYAIWAQAN
jgi:hypothetical protein